MHRRALLVTTLAVLAAAMPAGAAPTGSPTTVGNATNLDTPWEMLQMPDGRVLVTERPGRVRVISSGVMAPTPVYSDSTVTKFLGMALSPGYATNKHVFLYETADEGESRVIRLTDTGTSLTDRTEIFGGIGTDFNHDGGRIAFGPDGYLYVTTGDIHDPTRPRNLENLNGKILRMTEAGQPAPGNPFDTDGTPSVSDFVWSFGHRHPQGLTWDASGRLWETEHGPSGEAHAPAGASNGRDELNLIEPGKDYGWPEVAGDQNCSNVPTVRPVVNSGPAPAWAMADVLYVPTDGYLYAPALNGRHLHVFDTAGGTTVTQHSAIDLAGAERLRSATLISPSEMWIATHTAPMRIFSVGLSAGSAGITWQPYTLPAADLKTCDPPTAVPLPAKTPGTTPTTTTTPTTQTPPPVTSTTTETPPLSTGVAVTPDAHALALARRLRRALRLIGIRGLLRPGSVGVRAGGFAAGSRVSVRLQLRRAGRPALTVATALVRPRSRSQATYRVMLTRRGRAALRRATRARLTFRVGDTPPGGTPLVRTATTTLRR